MQQIVRKGIVNISQQIVPHYFQPLVHLEHVKVAFHIHPISVSLVFFVGNEVTLFGNIFYGQNQFIKAFIDNIMNTGKCDLVHNVN